MREGESRGKGSAIKVSTRRGGRQICPRAACTSQQVITRLQAHYKMYTFYNFKIFNSHREEAADTGREGRQLT